MCKGIAVVAGMGVDLKLIGDRYSVIVLIFFIVIFIVIVGVFECDLYSAEVTQPFGSILRQC